MDKPTITLSMTTPVRCHEPQCSHLPSTEVDYETAAWWKWSAGTTDTDNGRNIRQVASGTCQGAAEMLKAIGLPRHTLLHAMAEALGVIAVGQGTRHEDVLELVRMHLNGERARAAVHGVQVPPAETPLAPRGCATDGSNLA